MEHFVTRHYYVEGPLLPIILKPCRDHTRYRRRFDSYWLPAQVDDEVRVKRQQYVFLRRWKKPFYRLVMTFVLNV